MSLEEIIATQCLSLFEGCCCGRRKGHPGIHRCAAEKCGTEWNDEDEARWEAEMRREMEK